MPLRKYLDEHSDGDELWLAEAQLPQRVNDDGFEPVLALGLKDRGVLADWLGRRIAEIERLTGALPPVAVLVADENDVIPVAEALAANKVADIS